MSDYKLKICFLSPKAYPLFAVDCDGVYGGAEVDLYLLGTALAADTDFEVTFVVADYGQRDGYVSQNVRLLKSLKFGENPISSVIRIWNALRKSDSDIYFMKTMSPGMILLWMFSKWHRKKYILRTAHTTHCDGIYLRKHKLTAFIYKHIFRKASILFTQNQSDAEAIKKTHGIDSIVIPNGHRIEVAVQRENKYFLWVARSADFKNPRMFMKLSKAIPSQKFIMICPAAFGDKKYHELVKEAQEIDNLEFIQGVRYPDVQGYFDKASVFVNTSESEGFANTFIQAGKSAVPILSYKVNPDDFINRYQCGFCADGDWDRFTGFARQLSQDEELNRKFGENAFRYVKEYHDIDKIVEIYKSEFKRMVGNDT